MKNLFLGAAMALAFPAQAQVHQVTCFQVDGAYCYTVRGCVPGSKLEFYSQRGGGKLLATATADAKGRVNNRLAGKYPAAFILSKGKTDRGIKGTGKVVYPDGPACSFEALAATPKNGRHIITWEAKAPSSYSFQVWYSADNVRYEPAAALSAKTNEQSAEYQFDTRGDKAMYYTVAILNKEQGEIYRTAPMLLAGYEFQDLNVYPTVARDLLNIKLPQSFRGSYTIINVQGQPVIKGVFKTTSEQINIAGLSAGGYFLHIGDGATAQVFKFIKE